MLPKGSFKTTATSNNERRRTLRQHNNGTNIEISGFHKSKRKTSSAGGQVGTKQRAWKYPFGGRLTSWQIEWHASLVYSSSSTASPEPPLRCRCFSLLWKSVRPLPLPVTPTLPLWSSGDLKMLSFLRPEKNPTCKQTIEIQTICFSTNWDADAPFCHHNI